MESMCVMSIVEQPLLWCRGMCGFLYTQHECVSASYPLPKVDDTLAQIAGATVFSKWDARKKPTGT